MLPLSMKVIGNHGFGNCEQLSEIALPEGLNAIGSYAFRRLVSLTRISVPYSVELIGEYAFEFCILLAEVVLSSGGGCGGLKQIRNACLQGCKSLEQISIPPTVERIANCTFMDCIRLTDVELFDGLREIAAMPFCAVDH